MTDWASHESRDITEEDLERLHRAVLRDLIPQPRPIPDSLPEKDQVHMMRFNRLVEELRKMLET